MDNKKVMLIILDGFGYSENKNGNAVELAKKPFLEKTWKENPTILIGASGNYCGLPEGEMGTSECGHITIGSGRIIWQPLEEINQAIKTGDFLKKEKLVEIFKNCNGNLHLIGMLSDGGIHSHINHLFALLEMAKINGVKNVFIHPIADGRDTEMDCVERYLVQLEEKIKEIGIGKICDLIGRFYAMDRDKNFDRIQKAFDLYTKGEGFSICHSGLDPESNSTLKQQMLDYAYKKERNDYYIEPIKFVCHCEEGGTNDKAIQTPYYYKKIEKDDQIIFFNFRSDRAAQLTQMFYENGFKNFATFGPYTDKFPVIFSPEKVINNLTQVLEKHGKKQLRMAETEKFAHVTFYFNSQDHNKQPGETHILIDSPKVANYAQKPEMSAIEVTDKLINGIESDKYDFIAVNFANPDLVGHSGVLDAAIKAIETLDSCLSKIIPLATSKGFNVIITADHGNAEKMLYENGEPCATHTTNPVRLTLVESGKLKVESYSSLRGGIAVQRTDEAIHTSLKIRNGNFGLRDIAPTILDLIGIEKPVEMTGNSLIDK